MMNEQLSIKATDRSPDILFDFAANELTIAGESYPEDVLSFYHPVMEALEAYLGSPDRTITTAHLKLIYFNSSSAKVLMNIIELLDEAAQHAPVSINWYFDPEDDTMQELGEEFGEDIVNAGFSLKELTD